MSGAEDQPAPKGIDLAALDRIEAEERPAKAPGAPGGGEPSPAPAVPTLTREQQAEEWAEIPAAVGMLLCMALPELEEAYSEENCRRWGERMQRLAEKKGWSAEIIGPWPLLIVSSAVFVAPTLAAIKVRRAIKAGELPPEAARDLQTVLKSARDQAESKLSEEARVAAEARAAEEERAAARAADRAGNISTEPDARPRPVKVAPIG